MPDGSWFAILRSLFPGRGGVDVQRAWGPKSVPGLYLKHYPGLSCWCYSVTQSCLTLCDSMDCSTPGFPVLHQLPELAQTHVHWVGDAIKPSHPLLSPSPAALNLSQQLGAFPTTPFFASGGQSIGASASASVLPMNIQDWLPLGLTGWVSLQSKGSSSLLQHHSSKASILQHSAFFTVTAIHDY